MAMPGMLAAKGLTTSPRTLKEAPPPSNRTRWAGEVAHSKALHAEVDGAADNGDDTPADLERLAAVLGTLQHQRRQEQAEAMRANEQAFSEHDKFFANEKADYRFGARAPLNRVTRCSARVKEAADALDPAIEAFVARALSILRERSERHLSDVTAAKGTLQKAEAEKRKEQKEFEAYRKLDKAVSAKMAQRFMAARRQDIFHSAREQRQAEVLVIPLQLELANVEAEREEERKIRVAMRMGVEVELEKEREARVKEREEAEAVRVDLEDKLRKTKESWAKEVATLTQHKHALAKQLHETTKQLTGENEQLRLAAEERDRRLAMQHVAVKRTYGEEILRLRKVQQDALALRHPRKLIYYESMKSKAVDPLQPDPTITWRGQREAPILGQHPTRGSLSARATA